MATTEERKDQIKQLFKNLCALKEEDLVEELGSMVYGKIAIKRVIDCLRTNFSSPEELADAAGKNPVLNEIVGIAATYGAMGVEIGYAKMGDAENVSE